MKHFILTEEEKTRIRKMHKNAILTERPTTLINESAEAMVDDAKEKISSGDKPDQGVMDRITNCIKKNSLSNLMVLTTGAGAYALGLIAVLMGTGVGAPLALMMSGAVLIILEGIGINGQSASSEVKTLCKCMGY
jgi:hypothetical protein